MNHSSLQYVTTPFGPQLISREQISSVAVSQSCSKHVINNRQWSGYAIRISRNETSFRFLSVIRTVLLSPQRELLCFFISFRDISFQFLHPPTSLHCITETDYLSRPSLSTCNVTVFPFDDRPDSQMLQN